MVSFWHIVWVREVDPTWGELQDRIKSLNPPSYDESGVGDYSGGAHYEYEYVEDAVYADDDEDNDRKRRRKRQADQQHHKDQQMHMHSGVATGHNMKHSKTFSLFYCH